MCEPTSLAIASFALTAGGAVANEVGNRKQQKAVTKAANESYADTLADLVARSGEEGLAASLQRDQNNRDVSSARASATTSAAAAGLTGKSIDLLLNDFDAAGGDANAAVDRNRDARLRQIERQKDQAATYRDNQIVSAPQANPFLTALEIGGAGVNLATALRARNVGTKGA